MSLSSEYFEWVGSFKLLTKEEEIDLSKSIHNSKNPAISQKAKDLLYNSNLRLVIKIANSFNKWSNGLDYEDLIQEGNIGLHHAVEKFDHNKKVRFANYAALWIKAYMNYAIYNTSRTIRTPLMKAREISKLEKITEKFIRENDREPTTSELSDLMKKSEKQIKKIQRSKISISSMNSSLNDDNFKLENVVESEYKNPFQNIIDNETSGVLEEIINTLPESEKFVIINYYGLYGKSPMTFEKLGEKIGKTKQGARVILLRSIQKIKEKYEKIS
jgi:RNA polymerase sigma factor (sigma-70 family)